MPKILLQAELTLEIGITFRFLHLSIFLHIIGDGIALFTTFLSPPNTVNNKQNYHNTEEKPQNKTQDL